MINLVDKHSIKATLSGIKGKQAVLVLEDNQTLFWPLEALPKGVKIGSDIYLTLNKKRTQNQKNLAKELLNEILET